MSLIVHPCPACGDPERNCACTKADVREYILRCLELRRSTMPAPAKPRGHHKIQGAEVFPHDESHSHVAIPVSGRLLRMRMAETRMVKLVNDDEYCGGKDAA